MNNAFFSVVCVVQSRHSLEMVKDFIESACSILSYTFDHYELIFVVNGANIDLGSIETNAEFRKNCYTLELAHPVLWDTAVIAGLQRANGDFIANFDIDLSDDVDVLVKMYEKAQNGIDFVCAHGGRKWVNLSYRRKVFYKVFRRLGNSGFDEHMRPEFLISRRALNWVVQNRVSRQYINQAIFDTGFDIAKVQVESHARDSRRALQENYDLAWSTLLRSTRFPASLGKYALYTVGLTATVASLDALVVRFVGVNLVLEDVEYVPGWAFLVVLISLGFLALSVMGYAVLRSVCIIIEELEDKPAYTVKKFGRI